MMIESEFTSTRAASTSGHRPMSSDQGKPGQSPRRRMAICMGCGQEIFDQFILRVAPDLEWHASCLKCTDCQEYLDETCTCFVKDGKPYCRRDYVRQFAVKCLKCDQLFNKNDYVMRARNQIYHVDCFRCTMCSRQLIPGDEFALRDEALFCKNHHDANPSNTVSSIAGPIAAAGDTIGTGNDGNIEGGRAEIYHGLVPGNEDSERTPPMGLSFRPTRPISILLGLSDSCDQPNSLSVTTGHQASLSCSISSPDWSEGDDRSSSAHAGADGASGSSMGAAGVKKEKKDKPKTTRVRTVLNEKQLHTLRTCYAANPRPDALIKEQLVEMTGLSPRVIRVWFQNKRCKDKKKQILMKQIQQQQEKSEALSGIRLQGIGPLLAPSPSRHDTPHIPPVNVHQFQQNSAIWMKAQPMPDFQHPLHPFESHNHHSASFQQLIHDFGDPRATREGGALGGFFASSARCLSSDLSSPSCSETMWDQTS